MTDIVYRYVEKKRPEGEYLTGVPLADLTAEQFDKLPPHLQAAVKSVLYYEAVKPAKEAKP